MDEIKSRMMVNLFKDIMIEMKEFIEGYYNKNGVGSIVHKNIINHKMNNGQYICVFQLYIELKESEFLTIELIRENKTDKIFKIIKDGKFLGDEVEGTVIYEKMSCEPESIEFKNAIKETASRVDFINYYNNICKILDKTRNRFDYI